MKFKLDENFDPRLVELFKDFGHEADTVLGEGLSGVADSEVYRACFENNRILVTLDLDFSNPIRFPPGPTEGIIVVRPLRPSLTFIKSSLSALIKELKPDLLKGQLVISEPGRIRIYKPDEHSRNR